MTQQSHIWIIDDDDSIRWVLQKALESAGFRVTSFDNANTILQRTNKINRACFRKIFCRAADFSNRISGPQNLCQHLVVKNKVIGIMFEGKAFQ